MPELPSGDLLITGATGFLGGRFVRELLANGVSPSRLRCLVRDPTRAVRGGLPAESVRAVDLAAHEPQVLLDSVRGLGAVVHFAGTLKGVRAADFAAVNIDGTARLVAAVRQASPQAHVLAVSSLAAAGPSRDGATSALPPGRTRPVSLYGESKRRGELAVLQSGLPCTILRPPVVYGPGDGATRLLFRQSLAPLVAVPPRPTPLSVIHADDVLAAVWAALARPALGLIVPLDGPERTDTHAFSRAIAAACGRRARQLPVPMCVAAGAAHLADLWGRMRRDPGYFSRDKVREIAACGWVADPAPAAAALGFRATITLAEGLADVARHAGFVRRVVAGA